MFNLTSSETFSLIVLPLLIFTARVLDMTLDTLRIIFISRGRKFLATFFGFFEIIIWLFAIGQIMQNLTNITYYLAYACLLYTSDAADDLLCVDLGGRRIIKKKIT